MQLFWRIVVFPFALPFVIYDILAKIIGKAIKHIVAAWNYWDNLID